MEQNPYWLVWWCQVPVGKKITGPASLWNYCFGYLGTLIRETLNKCYCKHMLKNSHTFMCFLPKARIKTLWISYYWRFLKKLIMGYVRKQAVWIGEEKMLESAGFLKKKTSVCQKLPQVKACVCSICNSCVHKWSAHWLHQPMMLVQAKLLKRNFLPLLTWIWGVSFHLAWSFEAGLGQVLPWTVLLGLEALRGSGTQMPKWCSEDISPAKVIISAWDVMQTGLAAVAMTDPTEKAGGSEHGCQGNAPQSKGMLYYWQQHILRFNGSAALPPGGVIIPSPLLSFLPLSGSN